MLTRFKRVQNCESHLDLYSVPSKIIKSVHTLKIKSNQREDYNRKMWYYNIIMIYDHRWRKIFMKKTNFKEHSIIMIINLFVSSF